MVVLAVRTRARDAVLRVARAIREARPATVLAIAWLVLIVYAFPGQMSWDSFEYLHVARHGYYTDSHPPAISALWWLCEFFVAGPSGMLIVQSATFLLGLYAILRHTFSPRAAAWVAGAVFVFPPVMIPLAVIWAHSLMAGCLMLGVAGVLSDRPRLRLAGLLALGAATAFRPSALVATLPVVLLLFHWRPAPVLRRYTIAAGAWAAITLGAFGVDALLVDQPMHRWQATAVPHDIAGVLRFVPDDVPDAELRRILADTGLRLDHDLHAGIRRRYSSRSSLVITSGTKALWTLALQGDEPAPAAQREALSRAWRELVLGHPGAYLKHRFAVMGRVLGLTDRPTAVLPREPPFADVSLAVGVPIHASPTQARLTAFATWLEHGTPLFRPWIYLVIALALLGFARRHRDVAALLASGIASEVALLVIATEPDFRQSHWLVACTCAATAVLIARRARR